MWSSSGNRGSRRRRSKAGSAFSKGISQARASIATFPTSVNDIPLALTLGLPRDGGFGALLTAFGSFGNTEDFPPPLGRLELEEFNTPPCLESADTGPFFHNHTVKDLESAVAFLRERSRSRPAFQGRLRSR